MPKFVEQVWNDIRRGENIDLYVTILVATTVAILSILGFAVDKYLVPLTLATLALIAFTSLGNRNQIAELSLQASQRSAQLFAEQFPPELAHEFDGANEVWIVGVSLERTIKTYYPKIEKKLAQGDTIRVLLVEPTGPALEMAATRNYTLRDANQKSEAIKSSLHLLCEVKKTAPTNLEIRTIQYPLNYGAIVLNPTRPSGRLFLEHYCFRLTTESMPRFSISATEGKWYEFFKSELSTLWEAGVLWKCDG